DASGGGGAGGSVIISAGSGLSGVTVNARGGNGGSNTGGVAGPHGPGGGGGAGVIYSSNTLNAASSASGGLAGTTTAGAAYGAFNATAPGVLVQNQVIPVPMSCLILPVSFLSVSATGNNDKTNISWKVANDEEVLEYVIEKSINGVNFVPLGTLLQQASANGIGDYRFADLVPVANGISYYRVRAVTSSGRSSYSTIVTVKLSAPAGMLTVSPNPATESASLSLVSAVNGTAEVQLLDMAGHSCWHQQYAVSAGANTLPLEGLQSLRTGIYLLQYNDGSTTKQVKLLVRH
ncbi:MAG TPA: T9SS type A sorting domain-containing protein, partial [Chitinophagaceae bacterium]|nr:T9SS type A sorting domain-containing protein [Chitinophagaceae bacterium]